MEHWMIYLGIGWVLSGLRACEIWYVIEKHYYKGFDGADWLRFPLLALIGPAGVILLLCAYQKDCFRRSKREPAYWNESEGQITTKAGECLYDKKVSLGKENELIDKCNEIANKQNGITSRIKALENSIICTSAIPTETKILKAQLQCSAKGKHDMEYTRKEFNREHRWFIFTCSTCNLEITKIKAELTPAERDALKKLKLLQ